MPRTSRKKIDSESSKTKKNSDARVTENLRKIYENPDGSLPDMKTIEAESNHRGWKIVSRLLVVAALAVTGYFAWKISVAPRLSFADEIAVALSGPREIVPKTLSTYTVRYRNPGTSPVKNVTLYFEYPSYFTVSSSSQNFLPDSRKIAIGDLKANESGEITILGSWAETIPVTTTLTAVLNYEPNNFNSIFEKKSSLEIITPQVAVVSASTTEAGLPSQPLQVAFWSTDQKTTVFPGTEMLLVVSLINTNPDPIVNGVVSLSVVAPSVQNKSIINWSRLNDPLDGTVVGEQVNADLRRGKITWTAKEWKELENLAPGASTKLEIRLPVKTILQAGFVDFATSTITATAELRVNDKIVFISDPTIAKIQSDTTLSPNITKSKTGYDFDITVNNHLHALKDVQAEIELFGDFSFDQKSLRVPAGTAIFDPLTKKVIWKITTLPKSVDTATLEFSTITTPKTFKSEEIGKIIFSATDAEINEVFAVTIDGLKTPQ